MLLSCTFQKRKRQAIYDDDDDDEGSDDDSSKTTIVVISSELEGPSSSDCNNDSHHHISSISSDEPPPPKRVRFSDNPDVVISYQREEETPMKATPPARNRKFKEFFPILRDDHVKAIHDPLTSESAKRIRLDKLEKLIDTHSRVLKLQRGDETPLTDSEKIHLELPDPPTEKPETSQQGTASGTTDKPIDYQTPGSDHSEFQRIMTDKIKFQEYLVMAPGMKKFVRLSLRDNCVTQPHEDTDHLEFEQRHCDCCHLKVFIGDWPDHLKSYYHQIIYQFRVKMLGFCWFGRKDIAPHIKEECQTCTSRTQRHRLVEVYPLHDIKTYLIDEDQEYLAYLERKKALNTPNISDKYDCLPCGKKGLSKEYYEKHITGFKHNKMCGSSTPKQPTETTTPKPAASATQQPPTTTTKSPPYYYY